MRCGLWTIEQTFIVVNDMPTSITHQGRHGSQHGRTFQMNVLYKQKRLSDIAVYLLSAIINCFTATVAIK